jgi:lysozyme family protein
VNDPRDPGGATNKGITIATFRRYIKPSGTIADLKSLTTAQAVVVYKRQYWDAVSADKLPAGVDYATADFAVNSGPSRAAKYLQEIVGVAQDGKIGPATIAAVNAASPAAVIDHLCDNRLAFMKRIKGGKLWVTFGRGWQRRVDEVRSTSLKWAATSAATGFQDVTPDKPKASPFAAFFSALASILRGRSA